MQISASLVKATWPLQVLFCTILSYLVLGEVLKTLEYIGGVTIVVGLFMAIGSNFMREKSRKQEKEDSHNSVDCLNLCRSDDFVAKC